MSNLPVGITIRPLRFEEFHLASGPEGVQWPEGAVILGAWRNNTLVGRIGVVLLPHIEGLWVDEAERESGGQIARALHREIEKASLELGRPHVFAYCPEDKVGMAAHLARSGYDYLPIAVYGKRLEEEGE